MHPLKIFLYIFLKNCKKNKKPIPEGQILRAVMGAGPYILPPVGRDILDAPHAPQVRIMRKNNGKDPGLVAGILAQSIRQMRPVAPSLTIRVRLPRNLLRTSSGIRTTLAVSPSRISSYTDFPKILLSHSFSGASPVR